MACQAAPTSPSIFETGYGPSGLPHIGTFGEVARTTMVRHAFEVLTEGRRKTRLICFSDDMDGLRKVPDNVPNKDMLAAHIGKPLSAVPDPFGNEYPSFAAHNNARLRRFLDRFGFDYEFLSATECYHAGMFDATLLRMLEVYDKVMEIILPTLGPERRATYSPFLPVSPDHAARCCRCRWSSATPSKGTVVYVDPDTGKKVETPVTGGRVKCQWKADWALRWTALGVDYEMAGKDLIDSVTLSSKICRALGGTPPEGFNYELFLDESGREDLQVQGQRPDDRRVADLCLAGEPVAVHVPEAEGGQAALFRRDPARGRRVPAVPRRLSRPGRQGASSTTRSGTSMPARRRTPSCRSRSPCCSISSPASNAHDKDVLWGFIRRHAPDATPETHPMLDQLAGYAVRYYDDFVKPQKKFRLPTRSRRQRCARCGERSARPARPPPPRSCRPSSTMSVGHTALSGSDGQGRYARQAGRVQCLVQRIYSVLLGEERGPRFGSFIELFGVENTRRLIERALAGELVKPRRAQ